MNRKIFLVCMSMLWLFILGIVVQAYDEPIHSYTERARVLRVESVEFDDSEFLESELVTVEIISGSLKGKIHTIENILTGNFVYDLPVKPGDKVLVLIEEYGDGEIGIFISEYIRDTYIWIVGGIFVLLLMGIGRLKGLKTVITLGLTLFLILKLLLPGILKGYSPVLLTVGISFIITLITIFIVAGVNTKSFAAIIGVLGGVLVAGLTTFIVGSRIKLTGLSSQEASMLMYIPQGVNFDFRGLLFAGIIMGALGAVMDVAISIASALDEVKGANPQITKKELMTSGMNIGKDIMGTMSNTLILAYTGSTIPLLLLFLAYETDMVKIMNLDIIATEIIRALSGSIGLILTIPITVFASTLLLEKSKRKE